MLLEEKYRVNCQIKWFNLDNKVH